MQEIVIKIVAIGEPPPFPECAGAIVSQPIGITILEGGMQSGRTSVALLTRQGDTYCFTEFSADMFAAIADAVRGAVQRFEGGSHAHDN